MNSWKNKVDSPVISGYTYNVNNLGQRTAVATAGEAFDTASPADWLWSYDVLGQVKSANRDTAVAGNSAENSQYAYDQIGNRISSQKGNSPELSYVANNLNQYTTIGTSVTPTYDADGNQLGGLMPTAALPERRQLTFVYNAHNRPISVTKNDANNTILENYTHDHEGRRIQEGNTITIYDGYNAIAEYTVNGVLKTTYAWGLDLSNTLQGAGGVGGLLSQTDYTGQLPLISYPTYDGNGNVTEYLTEANNGTLAAHYEYDAFGNVINTNNPNNTSTGKQYRYQFSTKPYNRLTGLSYYNYRDYDPVAGRWIGRDSIAEKGGLNLYGFVGNNAIVMYDRKGRCPLSQTAFSLGTGEDTGQKCPQGSKTRLGEVSLPSSYAEFFASTTTTGWEYRTNNPDPDNIISTNGCSSAPDHPCGFDFLAACNAHDICYETCGKSKGICDRNFLRDLNEVCAQQSQLLKPKCNEFALIYYAAVVGFGDIAFEIAQDEACLWEDCPF